MVKKDWRNNPYAVAGWADYATGIPYPKAYDAWREVDQRNYENGRTRAANYALCVKRLPKAHVTKKAYLTAVEASGVGAAFLNTKDAAASIPQMHSARQHLRVAQ